MATNLSQDGYTTEFTAGADYSSGDVVVIGQQIGVVVDDVTSGNVGVAYLEGVFIVPKVSAAVIAQGESVIWDASAGAFDDNLATPATGDVSGCCVAWAAGANGETTIAVKLNVGIGTVA